jgi:hypothetical protein
VATFRHCRDDVERVAQRTRPAPLFVPAAAPTCAQVSPAEVAGPPKKILRRDFVIAAVNLFQLEQTGEFVSEEIVGFRIFADEIEANLALRLLEDGDVRAFISKDDAAGMEPHLQRTRVFVS